MRKNHCNQAGNRNQHKKAAIYSYHEFLELLIFSPVTNKQLDPLELCRHIPDADIVVIEDIDFLSGKLATQSLVSDVINCLSMSRLVILTGIDIVERIPGLYRSLSLEHFVYIRMQ